MRVLASFLVILVFSVTFDSARAAGISWPLEYRDDSTNNFIWDKRTRPLIESKTHRSFALELEAALSGPPGPVIILQNRYFVVSACVPHDCLRQGFFWLDTDVGASVGAIFRGSYLSNDGQLDLDSTKLRGELPEAARLAIVKWLDDVSVVPTRVEFTDATGTRHHLPTAVFRPPRRFAPLTGGPSFDCAKASTSIESLLCGDLDLSMRDLKLAEQYRRMLVSQPALPLRRQLTALQQRWLQQRDANCEHTGAPKECLTAAYNEQSHFLANWVPLPSRPQDMAGLAKTWFQSGELAYRGQLYAVLKQPDAGERIPSFNVELTAHHLAKVDSCAILVDLPVGTVHGNHSYGGVCSQPVRPEKTVVLVCSDDMVGHFGFRVVGSRKVSVEELAHFVADECFGG